METFFLGSHHPNWLRKTNAPLFISRRRLAKLNRLPKARGKWALDSSGFTELSMYGEWTVPVKQYVQEVRRFSDCIGRLEFAFCQDWMCEPLILSKTKLSVAIHQRRTLENYLELMDLAPELPWAPVIQGYTIGEYWDHDETYQKAGIDLKKAPAVGIGSICRRQGTTRANALIATLHADGFRNLHAFGYKTRGLTLIHNFLQSSDSLAWSYRARRSEPLPECPH